MASLRGLVARHPAPAFFALTFAVSWGGVLMVIGGPQGIRRAVRSNGVVRRAADEVGRSSRRRRKIPQAPGIPHDRAQAQLLLWDSECGR
jgi:hypothetical protein